jgi:hypothetical protein
VRLALKTYLTQKKRNPAPVAIKISPHVIAGVFLEERPAPADIPPTTNKKKMTMFSLPTGPSLANPAKLYHYTHNSPVVLVWWA